MEREIQREIDIDRYTGIQTDRHTEKYLEA